MNRLRLSPGRLTALWGVLRALSKLGGASEDELLSFAGRSALRAGGLPFRDGLRLAVDGAFVASGSEITLTPLGDEALSVGGEEDEPNGDALRLFASVLFLRSPPQWVAYWQGDPTSLDLVLPESERQVLAAAGIGPADDTDDLEAWAWWDALKQVPTSEETSAHRKAIGDAAEALTISYERARLTREGFPELASGVRWVAQESAAYGFDVASFRGKAFGGRPGDRLAIEVKGLALRASTRFHFFLTDHEWRTAKKLAGRYTFYLWSGVTPGATPTAASDVPVVVAPDSLGPHLPAPADCDESCAWKTASLFLPLSDRP